MTGLSAAAKAWLIEALEFDIEAMMAAAAGLAVEEGVADQSGTQETEGDTGAQDHTDVTDVTAGQTDAVRAPGSTGTDTEALFGLDLPTLPDNPITGLFTTTVRVVNDTNGDLLLDEATISSLDHGKYTKHPPSKVEKGKSEEFVATDDSIVILGGHTTGVEGRVRFFTDDDKKTIWTIHFNQPRVGSCTSESSIDGDKKADFVAPKPVPGSGANAFFAYRLSQKGGSHPQPKPAGEGGGTVSCRVSIVNDSKETIYLRSQDKASGDYFTDPAKSVAPGGETHFLFGASAGDAEQGCRGLMKWDIGDPRLVEWDLMWENSKGAKNSTASFLKPDDGRFHTLGQIDNGDENVPVTFTLSGGGGHAPSPASGGLKLNIFVANGTKSALTLGSKQAASGSFKTEPPATIPAGQPVQFTFIGPDDASKNTTGSVQWTVGDPKAATWSIEWDYPPSGSGKIHGAVDPGDAGFSSSETPSGDAPEIALGFALSGGAAPQPEPEDEFAPPPKSKQPTLRKGDDTSDGWVEYAQRLLNKNGAGLTVNGNFDAAMLTAVKAFQGSKGCQVDGVIGNETWSMLREAPHKDAIATDGRAPHSFKQKDAQARFVTEQTDSTGYKASEDSWFIRIVSVGEQHIDDEIVVIKVTQPGGESHTHHVSIGGPVYRSPDEQGNFHVATVDHFTTRFALKPGVEPVHCLVEAYLPQALGGDRWTGEVIAAA